MIARLALIAALALGTPALAQDPVVTFSESDQAMNAAIADAQQTLALFLARVLDPDGQPLRGDVLVKVGLPTVAGSPVEGEHVWIGSFHRLPDGSFQGLLVNEPAYLGDVAKGDQVAFTQDMMSDWFMLSPSGRYFGSYTMRVIHAQGAFGDAPFDQVFEPDPIPADWH